MHTDLSGRFCAIWKSCSTAHACSTYFLKVRRDRQNDDVSEAEKDLKKKLFWRGKVVTLTAAFVVLTLPFKCEL